MTIAKIVSLLGMLAMAIALTYGFTVGNFAEDGKEILSNPWGIVSLVDVYVGFTLFSMWIIYREKSLLSKIIWVALIMVLGFFIGSLYTFLALQKSGGDWKQFWMGYRAVEDG
ncbi:MAG: DUF1475 domain-containing protein [Anaerolineales bacterium]|nr:DUF1475 domain-containing protein [Anaerolineales bacterium]